MIGYLFASGEPVGVEYIQTLTSLLENFPSTSTVMLNNEHELETLLTHIGVAVPEKHTLETSDDFDLLYDFSDQRINEFSKEDFDNFYEEWIHSTQRDNSMDEYGQLLFILAQASSWNKRSCKIILRERV